MRGLQPLGAQPVNLFVEIAYLAAAGELVEPVRIGVVLRLKSVELLESAGRDLARARVNISCAIGWGHQQFGQFDRTRRGCRYAFETTAAGSNGFV